MLQLELPVWVQCSTPVISHLISSHDGQQVIISREIVEQMSTYINLAHTGPVVTMMECLWVFVFSASKEKKQSLDVDALRKYLAEWGKRESVCKFIHKRRHGLANI